VFAGEEGEGSVVRAVGGVKSAGIESNSRCFRGNQEDFQGCRARRFAAKVGWWVCVKITCP